MKTATVRELKLELAEKSPKELIEICLTLSKFKKENKELLTYLLYEKDNEETYIKDIKAEVEEMFLDLNTKSLYYVKKSIRKILRTIKKYIRYSKQKETEIELLLHFCQQMKTMPYGMQKSKVLIGVFEKQIDFIEKKLPALHEDLQYDFEVAIRALY
ncbi:MAG: hypothetical protein ACPGVH_09385 [Chitinophagales bacterium]